MRLCLGAYFLKLPQLPKIIVGKNIMTQGPELFYKPYGVGRTKGGIKLTGKL
jgi:hypothetical protein